MGIQMMSSFAMLKTQFQLLNKSFLMEMFYRVMLGLANSIWVLGCKYIFYLFRIIATFIYRSETDESSSKKNDSFTVDHSECEEQTDIGSSTLLEPDGSAKEESLGFFFGFQFQNTENYFSRIEEAEKWISTESSPARNTTKYQAVSGRDVIGRIEEAENLIPLESSPAQSTSKYQVISRRDVSGFIKKPETFSFTIQELFVASNDNSSGAQEAQLCSNDIYTSNNQLIKRAPSERDFQELNSEADSVESSYRENLVEKPEKAKSIENDLAWNEDMAGIELPGFIKSNLSDEIGLLRENQHRILESEPEPSSPSEDISIRGQKLDTFSIEFCSNSPADYQLILDNSTSYDERKQESTEKFSTSKNMLGPCTSSLNWKGEAEDSDEEYIVFEPIFLCSDFGRVPAKHEQESLQSKKTEPLDNLGKPEEHRFQGNSWGSDFEDEDGFDVLLQHQEQIEKIKMEMKSSVRNKGLPTILEESESMNMVEDLKFLRIDEKVEHKDRMEEIQKVYKSYAEKMRKLDILNYQTTHAISFLQLKDPVLQDSTQKYSVSAVKSFLCTSLWPCNKLSRIHADPILKSISELHRDLELVYVGQLCLSWEILNWQYRKAGELQENDSDEKPYNQVAGEFQQFQVLVQRFVENEPFQGPRIQNYTKNRCQIRTLLQVPAIKEDSLKDKKHSMVEGENVVSITMLTDIIDESMRVFWEFLHADKEEANVFMKALLATHVDLQDRSDSNLMMDLKASLQKKEKRLKDIVRSGNCIVRKFQKQYEGRMDSTLVFAQVELRLVSRVLNMPRLTRDQLVWCQKKLSNISLSNRKVHVEPSFLLFPF
ncbi:hypothetical protein NMG60_11009211 [Bertholletia excelsa]